MNPPDSTLSRRNFLKVSTLLTGGSVLGFPALVRARNAGTQALNIAIVGLGNQGNVRAKEALGCGKIIRVAALCDVDRGNIRYVKSQMAKIDPTLPLADVAEYSDYRELLAKEKDLDAVVVTTPDHWHYHIAKASLLAGKHVFCEKPLTHTLAEARELRQLAAKTKLITQMGNQGSASKNLRRAIELIQAGVLGQVKEVKIWSGGTGCHPGLAMPTEADPVPANFNWDAWLGPAPYRFYKRGYYHPWDWRGWLDFGSGPIGDFGCHNLNLPVRALKLDYPISIEAKGELMGLPTYPKDVHIRFEFAKRGNLEPVTIDWYDGGLADHMDKTEILPPELLAYFGSSPAVGVFIRGENGYTHGLHWTGADYIKLNGEKKLSGILNHPASKAIPETLPRSSGHLQEWVEACMGGKPVFSDFETGGFLTEICLAGVIAARLGKKLEWDGPNMKALNAPEADQYIHTKYRTKWI